MRKAISLLVAAGSAAAFAGSVSAAAITFGGVITARAGYGKNPGFAIVGNGTGGMVGGNVTATLARTTSTGRTALTGTADILQASGNNGRTQNYSATLTQSQQVTSKLSVSGDVIYARLNNPPADYSTDARDLQPISDVLAIGTRTRQISGDGNAAYQLTENSLFQGGFGISHVTYYSLNDSTYTQYSGSLGYLRTLNKSTKIGVQFTALRVLSHDYGNSSSYTGGLVLTQQISRFWSFQGGVNGLLQKSFGGTFTTIGFNGSLCGSYPRLIICALASREGAASAIGGMRLDTQGGVRVNYALSALSTVSFESIYDVSNARGTALPALHYFDSAISYRRTLTPRLSAGASARYQHRSSAALGFIPSSHTSSYIGTADIVYSFGRTS